MPYNSEQRITSFTMSVEDILYALSEGNPGALTVMIEALTNGEKIDPDSAMGNFTGLMSFDSYGIYGSKIWLLYNDICGRNIVKALALLRACQMGMMNISEVDSALAACVGQPGTMMPPERVNEVLALVRELLPRFGAAMKVDAGEQANG